MSSPWVKKIKTDKICLFEYLGKLKRIGNQVYGKINEMNIHTIADLQRYSRSYWFPKLKIRGFGQIYYKYYTTKHMSTVLINDRIRTIFYSVCTDYMEFIVEVVGGPTVNLFRNLHTGHSQKQ